jgi:hypothetical protein
MGTGFSGVYWSLLLKSDLIVGCRFVPCGGETNIQSCLPQERAWEPWESGVEKRTPKNSGSKVSSMEEFTIGKSRRKGFIVNIG